MESPKRLFPVSVDGKTGYINAEGRMVVSPQYVIADEFHDGLAQVAELLPDTPPRLQGLVNRRVGFIDTAGEMVVRMQYDWAREFSEGRAAVMVGKKWGFIDQTGEMMIEPQYDDAYQFTEGLAPVKKGRKYLFIDATGTVVFEESRHGHGAVSLRIDSLSREETMVLLGSHRRDRV